MANATTWDDFKELMREEYCPRDEIQKLENEYYDLKMEGSEIEAYTKRSHELAILCPNLSRPPPRRIELYIKGLALSCGDEGQIKRDCPQLNQNVNDNNNNNAGNNNNGSNGARGRSYVSLEFSQRLGLTPIPLEAKYVVELADGKTIAASHVLFGCKLDLVGQVFDIDLLSVTLGSFDVVVGMDWLSKHQAEILCKEKIVRIPLPSGESLSVQGHRSGTMVGIISAMQAQKCLRKGYPAILALVTDTPSEERKIKDLPVVHEFPEELLGLPPHCQVEFQIDLAPGVAPIARAPYRLAPGELQELSNQLQELLDRGFI
ncbi:uncharacterized protein LOC118485506 [Helianthus annuus]|uniref:uncharacterized protein LOC118485506 n=1 Tax=Helianthus annuus TaxID=4232 RepID=UPI001652DE47|nr:uncharacterized protein LOC118485506 [Helianthus annuus]